MPFVSWRSFLFSLLLVSSSFIYADVTRLGPILQPTPAPAVCQIIGVLPDSPANKSGLNIGDRIQKVNGEKPADASVVSELIDKSGSNAELDVINSSGSTHRLTVPLNKLRPRLGAICDLSGWHKESVSAAGNEAVTLFNGPYALTFSGVLDKGLAFMRVRLTNHADHQVSVSRALFSVTDNQKAPQVILSPQEVMYFMHGEDGVPYLKPPSPTGLESSWPPSVPANSIVRVVSPVRKKREEWTRNDESYVKANADYLSKESLWPMSLAPGETIDGLIYFLAPKTLPFTMAAHIEGKNFSAVFGMPHPSDARMSEDDLINFFNAQKKGTPVKLTLKGGKVFVGKYSSYDADNEIVWFDTPSGVLLNTSSFGLRHIQSAQTIAPESERKPTVEPSN